MKVPRYATRRVPEETERVVDVLGDVSHPVAPKARRVLQVVFGYDESVLVSLHVRRHFSFEIPPLHAVQPAVLRIQIPVCYRSTYNRMSIYFDCVLVSKRT